MPIPVPLRMDRAESSVVDDRSGGGRGEAEGEGDVKTRHETCHISSQEPGHAGHDSRSRQLGTYLRGSGHRIFYFNFFCDT